MSAMINKIQRTGDFYQNVMRALREQGGDKKALRLDILADAIEEVAADGSHRFRVLEKVKAAITSENLGLSESPFELIPAREQEGFGFSTEEFPKQEMPVNPSVKKRTRKARKAVEAATGQEEPKVQKNYWPIIAVKDPMRASIKDDIAAIADATYKFIRDNFDNRYNVVLGSKSFTVRFGGSLVNEDEDEDELEDAE